jgi:hypothetical protein
MQNKQDIIKRFAATTAVHIRLDEHISTPELFQDAFQKQREQMLQALSGTKIVKS